MNTLVYGRTVNAFWLAGIACALVMPDVVFGLLGGLIHLMFEVMHLGFEVFESALDHLVEHIFHTGTKETQIIVFYTMIAMGLGAGYFLWSAVIRWFREVRESLLLALSYHKQRFLLYWAESATNKFKLIAGTHVAMTVVYLTSF